MSYHKSTFVGRLTRDPEMRYTPSGQAVTNFSLAIDDDYTDPTTKVKVERTFFVRFSCWGKIAEIVNQWKHKGDMVLVEAGLTGNWVTGADGKQTSNGPKVWNAQDGTPQASYEFTAYTVKFLVSANPNAAPNAAPAPASSSATDPDASGIPF